MEKKEKREIYFFDRLAKSLYEDEEALDALKEYRTPAAGAAYESDIRAIFPAAAADEALSAGKYAEALKNENLSKVNAYLSELNKNG